jgi:hypothetical protein
MAKINLKQKSRWDPDADCCTEKKVTLFKGGTLGDCNSHCPQLTANSSNLELTVEILNSSGSKAYVDVELDTHSNVDVSPADYTNEPIEDGKSEKFKFTISDDGGQPGSRTQVDVDAEYANSSAAYNAGNMSSVKIQNDPVVTY